MNGPPTHMWCTGKRCKQLVKVRRDGNDLRCQFCNIVIGEWSDRAGLVYPPRKGA